MAIDDALTLLKREFKLWGVKFQHEDRRGGHIELKWQVTPEKPVRSYIIAKTPSDHRGWLNARGDIRKLLRADGLTPHDVVKQRPASMLEKALSLPKPVDTTAEQIQALRAEVADLTDLVLELTGSLKEKSDPAPEIIPQEPEAKHPNLAKAIEYVNDDWHSTEYIASSMRIPTDSAYNKLWYLKSKGKVELDGGRWRKAEDQTAKSSTATRLRIAH